MAKTKGLDGAKKKTSSGRTSKRGAPKKSVAFKEGTSSGAPPRVGLFNPRRSSLRNPVPWSSAPVPESSSPVQVSSGSDPSSSPSPAQSENPNQTSSPHSTNPPSSENPTMPSSGNFLNGRISLYDSCFSRRPIHLERQVEFSHFTEEFAFIQAIFENRGWINMGTILGSASVELIREFYTNFHNISPDEGSFDSLVRGTPVHISVNDLASFLRVTHTLHPEYPTVDWASLPPLSVLVVPMRDNPFPWHPGMLFRQSDLFVPFRILNLICDSLLCPTNRSSEISEDKIKLLYCLSQGVTIDLPSLVFQSMISAHKQKNSRLALPYGILLTNFLREKYGVLKRPEEMSLFPDSPINRSTIRRTMSQKQPMHSAPSHSSHPDAHLGSSKQPTSSADPSPMSPRGRGFTVDPRAQSEALYCGFYPHFLH